MCLICPEGNIGPLKTWPQTHLLPISEAIRVIPPPCSETINNQSSTLRSRICWGCEPIPQEEESDVEELTFDWLWVPSSEDDPTISQVHGENSNETSN